MITAQRSTNPLYIFTEQEKKNRAIKTNLKHIAASLADLVSTCISNVAARIEAKAF